MVNWWSSCGLLRRTFFLLQQESRFLQRLKNKLARGNLPTFLTGQTKYLQFDLTFTCRDKNVLTFTCRDKNVQIIAPSLLCLFLIIVPPHYKKIQFFGLLWWTDFPNHRSPLCLVWFHFFKKLDFLFYWDFHVLLLQNNKKFTKIKFVKYQ